MYNNTDCIELGEVEILSAMEELVHPLAHPKGPCDISIDLSTVLNLTTCVSIITKFCQNFLKNRGLVKLHFLGSMGTLGVKGVPHWNV